MGTNQSKKEHLTYDQMHEYYRRVLDIWRYNQCIDEYDFDYPEVLFAPARGGLDFGVKLSHHFRCELFPYSYAKHEGELVISDTTRETLSTCTPRQIWLVDDIADTGETLQTLKDTICETINDDGIKVITALSDIEHITSGLVDITGRVIDRRTDTQWFVFPWEEPVFGAYDD